MNIAFSGSEALNQLQLASNGQYQHRPRRPNNNCPQFVNKETNKGELKNKTNYYYSKSEETHQSLEAITPNNKWP